MILFTKSILDKLTANGLATRAAQAANQPEPDHKPVVKIFAPSGGATWLFTEIEGDHLFGLCDLGMGEPELGNVSRTELETVKGRFNLPMERDRWFTATDTLSVYTEAARLKRYITYDPRDLAGAKAALAQAKAAGGND